MQQMSQSRRDALSRSSTSTESGRECRPASVTLPCLMVMGVLVLASTNVLSAPFCGPHTDQSNRCLVRIPQIDRDDAPGMDFAAEPWVDAAVISGLLQMGGLRMSSFPTWVYVYYTPSSLWVGFRCEGTPGDKLAAEYTQHDEPVWRDESVDVFLDDLGVPRTSAHVAVNCDGVVHEALSGDVSWNPDLNVRTVKDAGGWSAVVGIPFRLLGVPAPRAGTTWTANFSRSTASRHLTCWVPVLNSYVEPDRYGRLVFGNRKTRPAQVRRLDPVSIGLNTPHIVCPAGSTFRAIGSNGREQQVFDCEGPIDEDGRFEYVIGDDRVRSVSLTVLDEHRKPLIRGFYPMQSPRVSDRAKTLAAFFAEAARMLPRFPAAARAKADPILAEARPAVERAAKVASSPETCSASDWAQLAAMLDDLGRQLDGVACHARMLAKLPDADFAVGLEGPMRKVMIKDHPFEGHFDDHYNLSLARNEHEGLQVVVIPFARDLSEVTVSAGALKSASGLAFDGQVEVSLVGHVDVADNPPYDVDYKGWWPDPLLSFLNKCDVKEGEHVAFWIDVATLPNTMAGDYEGTITIAARDCRPIRLKLNVHVWNFALADGTHLRNAFTFDEHMMRRLYGDKWDDAMRRRCHGFLLDHRLNIDHLYRAEAPDIRVVKYGAARGMNAFNVGGEFRLGKDAEEKPKLNGYLRRLKEAGLFEHAYLYGYDEAREPKFPEIREVFGETHRRFPGLKTMTTAVDHSFGANSGLRSVVDIWVPLTDKYNPREAHLLRREGRDMWWYICVVPTHPYANWFIEYPAIEARLLTGAMSYKYKIGGFLYYFVNLWEVNKAPITQGPYADWNPGSLVNENKNYTANGDGSLMCPGPDGPLSTIRLENIRDGFEDYEYLWLLRDAARRVRKLPQTSVTRAFLERAAALLAVPDSVVTTTMNYTRDPRQVTEFRTRLAEAILEGQGLPR